MKKLSVFILANGTPNRIENHAKVARNQYLSLLSRYSELWWRASYGVTILLNMLILSCSSYVLVDGSDYGGYCYRFKNVACAFLGFFHFLFWLLSTTEFYFIQLPILINRHSAHQLAPLSQSTDPAGRPMDNRSLTRFLLQKVIV